MSGAAAMPPGDMESQFRQIVQTEMAAHNLHLSPSGEQVLNDFLETGIGNQFATVEGSGDVRGGLESLGGGSGSQDDLSRASENLRTFMGAVAEEAAARRTTNIGVDILKSVKNKLCPLFPFC